MQTFYFPIDANGKAINAAPPYLPYARHSLDTISSSTSVTLDQRTEIIEVTAVGAGIYLRWGTSSVTSSNFDEYVPPGATRYYVVPINRSTGSRYTGLHILQDGTGGKARIIEK